MHSTRKVSAPVAVRSPALDGIDWLVHGFSTRTGGVSVLPGPGAWRQQLNLATGAWDSASRVEENRKRLLRALDASKMNLLVQQQIHSDLIRVASGHAGEGGTRGDGLITKRPGLLLAILSADCLPILLADVRRCVVAAVHAGWRGTLRRIAQKAVGDLRMFYGSRPEDLRVAIGPGIRACCYQVGEDVVGEFESQFVDAESLFRSHPVEKSALEKKYPMLLDRWKGPRPQGSRAVHLDLVAANLRQLEEAGVARERIDSSAPCTHCHPRLYFSARRDGPRTGRMLGVIGIRRAVSRR